MCELAARAPGGGRSGLEREDRLAARDAPGDPRELARVAERLEVEQDEVRRVVVLPPLEQVVRRDVGLVADRDEGREAELALRRPSRAARARARRSATRSRSGRSGARAARTSRSGRRAATAMPRQFGPTSRAPCARTSASSAPGARAFGAGFGEAGRNDAERAHAVAKRRRRRVEHLSRGNADHREVDRSAISPIDL